MKGKPSVSKTVREEVIERHGENTEHIHFRGCVFEVKLCCEASKLKFTLTVMRNLMDWDVFKPQWSNDVETPLLIY